ncbi:MAG: hypothetical protein Q8P18_28425 [Pseudomonadota bacterium]|nr:hypothetical protein [Pseudomonadota bacterium]
MLLLPALLLLAGSTPLSAAGTEGASPEGPDARLERLIAAVHLDRGALRGLAASDPAVVYQLLDPASRAALDLVLALPPGEIRRVRDGQTVIRTSNEWSDAESAAVRALADVLETNVRRVDQVRATVVAGELVRVELAGRGVTTGVSIAWPGTWRHAEVAAALRAELGVKLAAQPPSLVDASFEDAHTLGLVWRVSAPAGTRVSADSARALAGRASLRLESEKGARSGSAPRVSQDIRVVPGQRLVLNAAAAREGSARVVIGFGFEGAIDNEESFTEEVEAEAWERVTVPVVVPEGATAGWVTVSLLGAGAGNVDDLVLAVEGRVPSARATWQPTTSGGVTVLADFARVTDPVGVASRIEWALLSGLGNLSISPQGTATVYVYADADHREALGAALPGDPDPADDPEGGTCSIVVGSPWSAACPIAVMLTRAWGPAGNPVMATGLPRALAGSGADLDASARASMPDTPRIGAMASVWRGAPSEVAAATSFAAWLQKTQGVAGVRAAWLAAPLAGYAAAGRDLDALDAAWRVAVGP